MLTNNKVLLSLTALTSITHAWMPWDHELDAFNRTKRFEALGKRDNEYPVPGTFDKIRGVNFGGWLISEPWMMGQYWGDIGCSQHTEFDCVSQDFGGDVDKATNGDGNRQGFKSHWASWINPDSVQSAHDVGLNTIRIPIGYWSYTDIVDTSSEHFPDGNAMLPYLDAVVQKATDLGMFVIIDFHGAPGAQQTDPFTGQNPANAGYPAGFFDQYNYDRAAKWLSWMTDRIHNNPNIYKSVGIIEVLNEPVSRHDDNGNRASSTPGWDTLTSTYYPQALKAVRDAEAANPNFKPENALTVQFMDTMWLSQPDGQTAGQYLPSDGHLAYDDHNYLNWMQSTDATDYIRYTCQNNRVDNDAPKIVGEWSLATNDGVSHGDGDHAVFSDLFTVQQQEYEKTDGWVFWSWRTELQDYRWTYSYLTYLNMIPTDSAGLTNNVNQDVCSKY